MVSVMGYTPDFAAADVERIKAAIMGRMAARESNANYLAYAVASSPDGPHLEIGVLHGATAILAGLMRPAAALVLVDPLDGYYISDPFRGMAYDPVSRVDVSPSVLQYNLGLFDMTGRANIWCMPSRAFFDVTPETPTYASAYIDGNHWGHYPMFDWFATAERMLPGGKVVIDDVDREHPHVVAAVDYALIDRRYELEFRGGITAVFRRKEAS